MQHISLWKTFGICFMPHYGGLSRKEGRKEGSVPCPGQPELAYKGEKFSSRDRFRPC